MTESLPFYVTAVFVLTTILTIGLLLRTFQRIRPVPFSSQLLTFIIPFWLVLTAFLSIGGFYSNFDILPPPILLFGILPPVLLIAIYFVSFSSFIDRLSLKALTWLSVVRVPVELVLLWLFQNGLVPEEMTFEGRNIDIIAGLTAPLVAWIAFRGGRVNKPILVIWNVLALASLVNIVTIAILSFPGPLQRFGIEHPNVGLTYFPFIWLPTIIVPTVLFAHLASLWQLARKRDT
jgi:hypothetical protein